MKTDSRKVVADTSAFIAVALDEPEKQSIIQQTEECILISLEVLPFEIGNALIGLLKKKVLEKNKVIPTWDVILNIPVELYEIDIKASLDIAIEYNIYAYDSYFLRLANDLQKPLLTLDSRMKMVAKDLGITVMEL